MAYDAEQLAVDVAALQGHADWQDEAKRPDFIRQVAVGLRGDAEVDAGTRNALVDALWSAQDGRGLVRKAADFTGRAVGEVIKSVPAMGGAGIFALSDMTGFTDTGSGTRLKRGVANLWDSAGQRAKQMAPGESRQSVRDGTLEALRADLDGGNYPEGLERWLAGDFDGGEAEPDEETRPWIEALGSSFARQAVEADYMGKLDPEQLRTWQESDRNPTRADSDIPGEAGPRELLADYVATRDPRSWDAFVARVTETDAQHATRLRLWVASQKEAARTQEAMPEGLAKELVGRSFDMQGSPIDLASAAFPLLRGGKALQAARAGGTLAAVGGRVAKGAGKEALQEGGTAYLEDPRNTAGVVAEAAGLGAVGSGIVEGTMATAGAGLGKLQRPGRPGRPGGTDGLPTNETTGAAAGGNPFAGPIVAPPQPTEDGRTVDGGVTPGPLPGFVDDPYGTAVRTSDERSVLKDFGVLPRTPAAQAALEAAQKAYADSQARAMGKRNQSQGKMPVIPDNPLGYHDILDFVNENPLHIPRAGSEAAKAGEYDWVQGYDMPKYYRRFLATSEGGHNADVLAQMAFDEGYIQEPTPDALIAQIDRTMRERTVHKVEFRRQQQAQAVEEKQVQNFEKDQAKPNSVPRQRLALEVLAPGDQFRIGEEDVVVRQVDYDDDGAPVEVIIEDGKRYGIMSLDPQTRGAILVDGFKPRESVQAEGDAVLPDGETGPDPFLPRRSFQRVSSAAARAAEAARSVMQKPAVAPAAVPAGTSGPLDLAGAYVAAATAAGSSSQMLPIARVFEAARGRDAALTPDVFLNAVREAYDAGGVYLESYDSPEGLQRAGQFTVKDAMGVPAIGMMVPQAEETLSMRSNAAAVTGPLPSTYSGAAPSMPTPQTTWSGKVQTLHGIREFLLNAVGLPAVGVGRFGQKALGVYKLKPESIRLQALNDIPVLSHEIGHHIHYRFLSNVRGTADTWRRQYDRELLPLGRRTSAASYTHDQVVKEGVAEFTRLWLTDPATARAAAPVFSLFWEQTLDARAPEAAEALREARDMIADYVAMPAFEKAKAQLVFDLEAERPTDPWPVKLSRLYAQMVNTLQPALNVVQEIGAANPNLEAQAKAVEMWMENHRGGWASKAGQDVFGHQTDLYGTRVGPGLQTILKDLKPGDRESFATYLALKRAAELEARGKRSGFEQARLPHAELLVLELKFESTRKALQKWMKNGRNLLVQAGLLDARSAQAMDAANQDYVPFYRLYEKMNGVSLGPETAKNAGGYVDLQSGIRKIKGSDRAIIDPLNSIMKNAFMFRKLAEQNHIGVQFFDLVRQVQGHGKWGETIKPKQQVTTVSHAEVVKKLIEQGVIQQESDLPVNADLMLKLYQAMTKPDTKNGEVIIFKNGKREHWEVKDALLMEALKKADADAAMLSTIGSMMVKLFGLPARVLRWGATGGPWFAVPNFIRDTVQGGVMSQSPKGGFVPFVDSLKGAFEVLRKGHHYERWKEAGGEFSGMVTGTQAFARLVEDALPKEPMARRMVEALAHPKEWRRGFGKALDLVGAFGKFTEEATRVGEFMRAKKHGASDMAAANLSKTLSLNFARAGEVSRVLNQFIPFFNATVQGLDQFYRAHSDPKTRSATIMKGLMYITLPSLLCWALGKDDEEIQNLPDYRKNLFWNINLKPLAAALGMPDAGFILSIPKPFLLGAVYGTSVEKMLDHATGRDPNGARKMAANVLGNTIDPFEVVTQIAGVRGMIEAKTNHSFFTGREVVPQNLQQLPPEYQYDVMTSQTARMVGQFTGQSPMMIDHLVRSYFATAGTFGTDLIDMSMAATGLADLPPSPKKGVMEYPILKRFAASPYAANAFVQRFHEASKDMEGKIAVLNKQAEGMTTAEREKWWKKNADELGHYLRIVDYSTNRTGAGDVRKTRERLSEIGTAMKDVQASRGMNAAEKRARLLELSRQRNEIAEMAYKELFPESVRRRHY